jgi:5-hydroxyisourate hydrolase
VSHVTTHVLDAAVGRPASGVALELQAEPASVASAWRTVATGVTDADGRVGALGPDALDPGRYRIVFDTGAYFAAQGTRTFYPQVTLEFTLDDPFAHYHVPLLLSPFAYSTYRGS